MIKINFDNPDVITSAIETLRNGGLVVYPTETCYGVGVDATNAEAVSKLLKFKKRPEGKAISVAVDSKAMADAYVEINNSANNLYEHFLPGPLTIISKSKNLVDKRLESEKGTLGVRIPKYDLTLQIIKEFGKPITTTSANSAGGKVPYNIQDVLEATTQTGQELLDLIIDAGELPKNPPSTVIDTTTEELVTYRKGGFDPNEATKEETTNSEEETIDLGYRLMERNFEKLKSGPVIFLLEGDLGSGKTQLTKGIAKYLKVEQTIKSPTYTYATEHEYDMSNPEEPAFEKKDKQGMLYHLDAWRIESIKDLKTLGIEKWMKARNVIVIEWPSVIEQLDKDIFKDLKVVKVIFESNGENERKIVMSA